MQFDVGVGEGHLILVVGGKGVMQREVGAEGQMQSDDGVERDITWDVRRVVNSPRRARLSCAILGSGSCGR